MSEIYDIHLYQSTTFLNAPRESGSGTITETVQERHLVTADY